MKKRVSILLAMIMALTAVTPVFATDYGPSNTSANMLVTATLTSTYTVTVPATLALDTYNEETGKYEGTYKVSARGSIANSKKVTITPAATFTMTGSNTGTTAEASVTQEVTTWMRAANTANKINTLIGTESEREAEGHIEVELVTDDEYSGSLTFTYGMADA